MKNDLKKYCVVPLLILLLSACGSGSDTEQPTDTKPPEDTDPVAVVAPSIQPVDSPTHTSTQTLSGEKIANSAIWINDVERVPLDASTTWTVSDVLLNEGKNIFSIYAKNMAGDKSAELSLTILLDTTPPAKPTVTSPLSTTTSDYRLTGNKDANSSIFYNGVEVIPVNSNTTWLYDITLDTGENVISLTSRDVVGNESAIESTTITLNAAAPVAPAAPTVNPVTSPTNSNPYIISGTKESGSSIWINGAEVVGVDNSTEWTASIDLSIEGQNTFIVSAKNSAGIQSLTNTAVVIELDSTPPSNPVVNSSLAVSNATYLLTGSNDAGSSIWLNGSTELASDSETTWFYSTTLVEGENSFSVTARDAIGNESASVTVVVVLDTTAPEIPSVTSALFVNYDNYMLVGTKESNSSIRINGVEQIPIDDATTWQFNTTLSEGNNVYSITSQDVFGHESSPASITVVLDTSVPTKPTVTSALETNQTSYTLTGTKATNTSIWVDGQERINSNSATDWSWVTSLSEGENIFSIVSKNRFDTASLANLVTVTLDTTPPGPITNFTATPDEVIMDSGLRSENGALDLTWTNPTDSDFSGVRILRSSEGFAQGPEETASQKIEINFESGTSARDTDYRLLSGLPYYYTAYTYDNLGNFTTTPTLLQATPGMPGDLDHSFNAPRGYARSEYMNFVGSQYITTTSNDSARAVAVQKDGKVVVVGNARNSYMDVYRFTRDGALDLTFNLAGKVDRLSSVWGPGYGIALQEDGKIVVVGSYFHESRGYEDMTVWRFTSDGKIDTSFNRFGYVTHDTGIKLEQDNMGSDVVVQPDGKIVVAGYGLDIVTNEKFMTIWRFTTSGALDTTFNGKGWATHNVSEISTATSLILQSDGKIVVAGSSNLPAENARMTLWRFTQNGQLDSTFNSSGIITYSNTPGSNDMSYANDLALQADGKIVVVGNSRIANNIVEMTIWRYISAGVLDTDFNATGKASHSTGIVSFAGIDRTANADMGSSVLIQQDGKIVVAGEIRYESATLYDYQTADMALWRYLDTGVLDKTFNATGAVIMNHGTLFAPDFTFTTSFDQEYATDVALQTNGDKTNIIVVGASAGIGQYFMSLYYSNLQDLTVWRYLQ